MNRTELKALFMAQYLGQQISYLGVIGKLSFEPGDYHIRVKGRSFKDEAFLLLRSIDQINIDEKKLILNASYSYNDVINDTDGTEFINNCFNLLIDFGRKIPPIPFQLLLRIGILLPFCYLNENQKPVTLQPDEIVAMGWAKIKMI